MQTEPLKYGHFYHIYNRGIDSCDLFREPDNYEHFLGQYDKYISPVAETPSTRGMDANAKSFSSVGEGERRK